MSPSLRMRLVDGTIVTLTSSSSIECPLASEKLNRHLMSSLAEFISKNGWEGGSGSATVSVHSKLPEDSSQTKDGMERGVERRKSNRPSVRRSSESNQETDPGRSIPLLQGRLHKRSKGINRSDWKKKLVTLTSNGKLMYHASLKDYLGNVPGKEVYLGLAAVRIPCRKLATRKSLGGVGDLLAETSREGTSTGGSISSSTGSSLFTPRSARKSLGTGRKEEGGEECFEIITCDQRRWEFCAASAMEREAWVKAIESQIETALHQQLSNPRNEARALGARTEVQSILDASGNERCADCSSLRPEWASLNLGIVICMECSGVHRNLGSHISKVRSLKLDDWPVEHIAVMKALGNGAAKRVWEAGMVQSDRIRSDAPTDVREAFIRSKYASKRWLAPLTDQRIPIAQQLRDAVLEGDVQVVADVLIRATSSDVNAPVSSTDRRTALHLAASVGCVASVVLLLWNGADLRAVDDRGRNALEHAVNGDSQECADLLISAGLTPDNGVKAPTTGYNRGIIV